MQAHGKCAANSPEFPEHLLSHDLPITQTDPKQTVVVVEEKAGVAVVRVTIVTDAYDSGITLPLLVIS